MPYTADSPVSESEVLNALKVKIEVDHTPADGNLSAGASDTIMKYIRLVDKFGPSFVKSILPFLAMIPVTAPFSSPIAIAVDLTQKFLDDIVSRFPAELS